MNHQPLHIFLNDSIGKENLSLATVMVDNARLPASCHLTLRRHHEVTPPSPSRWDSTSSCLSPPSRPQRSKKLQLRQRRGLVDKLGLPLSPPSLTAAALAMRREESSLSSSRACRLRIAPPMCWDKEDESRHRQGDFDGVTDISELLQKALSLEVDE